MIKNITTFDFKELNKFDKIFVLVSGGIDSTYLYEIIKQECINEKIYPVNCWNPYETSKTLDQLRKEPRFIEVKPLTELNYRQVLTESFMKIPDAVQARKNRKYHKKIFPCCRIIKHAAFLKSDLFKEENTVVIDGIKYGDGQQRRFWLQSLRTGKPTTRGTKPKIGFYHRHKGNQLYCYPFRDYGQRELPIDVIRKLRITYSKLDHSGCAVCPVLVLFQDRIKDEPRMDPSLRFWNKLSGQNKLEDYNG